MAVKPGYKRTEVGVIPEDWKVSTLGVMAQTSSGTTPARAMQDRYYRNGTIAWVKTLDLNNSDLVATSERVTELALKETCLRVYPVGTVLVAMYGGFQQIGRTGLLRLPAAVNQAITAIQPKGDTLISEYLLGTLNYRVGYWRGVASSSRKDPNISSQDIRNFPIAYTSTTEQRAIAGALSDVDALLGALDQFIAKKRDLKQAAMQQLLTGQTRLPGFHGEWEVKRLGEITTLYQPVTISARQFIEAGYPVYGANGVVGFYHDFNHDCWQITVTCRGSTCGTVNRTVEKCWITGNAMVVNCGQNKDLNKDFLYYVLLSQDLSICITGTGQPQIVRGPLANLELSIPHDTAEQTAIAEVLTAMDAELAALEQRRDKTRALKQGMMQELLTGRTRLV